MQAGSGAAEVELFSDSDKVAQVAKLDVAIHMLQIIIELNKILDRWNTRAQTWVYGESSDGNSE